LALHFIFTVLVLHPSDWFSHYCLQKTGRLKMQDWKMTDENAGLENAGLENDGRKCTAGK